MKKNSKHTRTLSTLFPSKPLDRLTLNDPEFYENADPSIDLGNGCVIIGDIVADLAADIAIDTAVDVVNDAIADAVGDIVADIVADAAADAAADTAAGISEATVSRFKFLVDNIGKPIIKEIVNSVSDAIGNAVDKAQSESNSAPSSADLWNALYDQMFGLYPCDNGYSMPCGENVRYAQEAMIIQFALNLTKASPASSLAAENFKKSWSQDSQVALKLALQQVSNTHGIPTMIKYMAAYTHPDAQGAVLVIATSNILLAVADYAFEN
ncbi:MAG: hypothetical protein WCR52_07200 [Bacteroidota bacterium]